MRKPQAGRGPLPHQFGDPHRSESRKALFRKQLERASKDVDEWPDYLKRVFGVVP